VDVADSRTTATRYRLILDLARDVTAQRDLGAVLDATFAALRQLLDFGGGSIALVGEDGWISFAATDPPAPPEAMAARVRVGEGVSGRIAETGEPVYIADITTHPDVTPERRARSVSAGVVAYFGVPLVTEGHPIGVLQIDSPVPGAWSDDERVLLLSFTPIVAAAVQNARLYSREQEALRRLQELDQRQRDFVAMVSHELRTPLTAVLGYADTVLNHQDELAPDAVLALVERSRGAAARLAVLVEELLDLSVVQRDELRLTLAPVDLAALLAETVAQYRPAGHPVCLDVDPALPPLVTDAGRLTQIVGNLVANAAKFSPDGAPVAVTAAAAGDRVEIRVADRGVGIGPEDRERIFERFVQLEHANVRSVGGFGLGLYVVRRVCEALGACIAVEGDLGEGSTFVVSLPRRPVVALP
jgi:signal transduction histidine kinase